MERRSILNLKNFLKSGIIIAIISLFYGFEASSLSTAEISSSNITNVTIESTQNQSANIYEEETPQYQTETKFSNPESTVIKKMTFSDYRIIILELSAVLILIVALLTIIVTRIN